jgi:tRNA(Ile)-lysidine synthase
MRGDALPARVAEFLHRHPPGQRLCVGYSGGLDSTVLLHLLAGLRGRCDWRLSAVHVHHGLSPRADDWAEHCRYHCAVLDVPLQVERVVVRPAGQGLEAAAREARYRVFAELETDSLALAQHRDDQAETLLLQLLRGAGPKGLAAMPAARELGRIRLLRPLLGVSRRELEAHARAHGLGWVEDESNGDPSLTRNALRHRVMPLLEALSPGAVSALARAAAQFAESAALLDDLARLDAAEAISKQGANLSQLGEISTPRARNLLRYYLVANGVAVQRERLCEALEQMLGARADAAPCVDFGASSLRRFQGHARLVPNAPIETAAWVWRGEAELDLGTAGALEFRAATGAGARLLGNVTVALRQGGERLRPHAGRPTRSLKNLLREAGIPPWERERLPLLYVDGRLAWAAGIGADAEFQAAPGEAGWLISWRA